MSIADKITSIEEHLTDDYEGLENLGADLTNIDKNIYNIRTCLDNIYSSLPKTTGEGSNLSLSPTLKGKLNIEAYKGDTQQEDTPTPSTPIDIEVVTGQQEVVVQNKNLANVSKTQIGKAWNNSSNSARAILVIPIEHSTQYTISYGSLGSVEGIYYGYRTDEETAGAGVSQMSTNPTTITTNDTNNYIIFQFNKTSISLADIQAIKFQLEKGSTKTDFVEHQEQTKTLHLGDIELAKIGTYQDRIYKNNDKWYIEKNYEKVTLANYTWLQNSTSTTGKNRYYTNGLASIIEKTATNGTKTTKGLLCNILTESTPNNNYLCTDNSICSTPNGQTYVYVESISGETGTTALMNLLTNTNAYALIPLATTTYTEITNETLLNELNELEKMMSYNGQTNISVTGSLPMILSVSALKGE